MPNIGIDIMGGDHAPQVVLEGCQLALDLLKADSHLYLFGAAEPIEEFLNSNPRHSSSLTMVPASQRIGMEEHPVKAIQQKPEASLNVGLAYLNKGFSSCFRHI